MPTVVDTRDIVRGEDRKIRFNFGAATFPTGAASWTLSLTLTQTKFGTPVITKTFGVADYTDEEWEFTIAAASSTLLTADRTTYAQYRRTDSGFNQILCDEIWSVG